MVRVTPPFFNAPSPEGDSLTRTNSLLRRSAAPVLRDDAVFWSAHLYLSTPQLHQRFTLTTTIEAVMRFSMCYHAHVQSWSNPKTAQLMISGGMSNRMGVLPRVVEVSNIVTSAFLALGTT